MLSKAKEEHYKLRTTCVHIQPGTHIRILRKMSVLPWFQAFTMLKYCWSRRHGFASEKNTKLIPCNHRWKGEKAVISIKKNPKTSTSSSQKVGSFEILPSQNLCPINPHLTQYPINKSPEHASFKCSPPPVMNKLSTTSTAMQKDLNTLTNAMAIKVKTWCGIILILEGDCASFLLLWWNSLTSATYRRKCLFGPEGQSPA